MKKFNRVLVPTDFSEHSKHAIDYALELPFADDGELILVHAIEPSVYPIHQVIRQQDYLSLDQQVHRTCEQHLADLVAQIGDRGPKIRTLLLDGHPFAEILAAAEREKVDLIVIATHGHTGIKHLLLGSTAETVVRKSPCPVLTVR